MKISPQHDNTPLGYPAHHCLRPLQTVALVALACASSSCDQTQQRTLGEPPILPQSGYKESQSVTQKKKVTRQRTLQKPTGQAPRPASPTTIGFIAVYPPTPDQIPEDGSIIVRRLGDVAEESFVVSPGGVTGWGLGPSDNKGRDTIINIDADTPSNEP